MNWPFMCKYNLRDKWKLVVDRERDIREIAVQMMSGHARGIAIKWEDALSPSMIATLVLFSVRLLNCFPQIFRLCKKHFILEVCLNI